MIFLTDRYNNQSILSIYFLNILIVSHLMSCTSANTNSSLYMNKPNIENVNLENDNLDNTPNNYPNIINQYKPSLLERKNELLKQIVINNNDIKHRRSSIQLAKEEIGHIDGFNNTINRRSCCFKCSQKYCYQKRKHYDCRVCGKFITYYDNTCRSIFCLSCCKKSKKIFINPESYKIQSSIQRDREVMCIYCSQCTCSSGFSIPTLTINILSSTKFAFNFLWGGIFCCVGYAACSICCTFRSCIFPSLPAILNNYEEDDNNILIPRNSENINEERELKILNINDDGINSNPLTAIPENDDVHHKKNISSSYISKNDTNSVVGIQQNNNMNDINNQFDIENEIKK